MGPFAGTRLLAACSHVQFHGDSCTCRSSGSKAKKHAKRLLFQAANGTDGEKNKVLKRLSKDKAETLNICEQQQQQQNNVMCGDATRRGLGADLPRLRRRSLVNRQEVVNKMSGALPLPGPAFSHSLDFRHKTSGDGTK